jgi:hypothetical protein
LAPERFTAVNGLYKIREWAEDHGLKWVPVTVHIKHSKEKTKQKERREMTGSLSFGQHQQKNCNQMKLFINIAISPYSFINIATGPCPFQHCALTTVVGQ